MPYGYHFDYDCSEGPTSLSKILQCDRCQYNVTSNVKCQRRVCIGLPYCWQHSKQMYNVRVKDSRIAGKGLFVETPSRLQHDVRGPVFKKNDFICPYNGKRIKHNKLNRIYPGDCVAPYAWCGTRDCEDAASKRGIGSLANGEGPRRNRIQTNARLTQFSPKLSGKYFGSGPAPRNKQVWLQATRDIYNGEEIIIEYGDDYWHTHETQYRYQTKYRKIRV